MNETHDIGIVMHSAEGALLCYRTAVFEGIARLGTHHHPTITMSGQAMYHSLGHWDRLDLPALRAIFAADASAVAAAGADFFVLPDNTAHIALEAPGESFAIPCLHIAEVVGDFAAANGFAKVGILGTNWTMEGPVYAGAFDRRSIDRAIPGEAARATIHDTIMDEYCMGEFRPERTAFLEREIEGLARQGCDAVALVCTELPIVLTDDNSPLPVIDSTRLLAKAAVDVALGDRPMPEWRGGPVCG
ncbi:aspartate/glutamate racemase family protein [Parasphingopyxis algicola]|uniref:aspartate/glutamate racemase family protein n=1 Tax=Parasphingopyxis algicola TaxID=2026624 RepID=UPI001C408D5C|nr:amino acid racemase [Parasphingopyxis algicola]